MLTHRPFFKSYSPRSWGYLQNFYLTTCTCTVLCGSASKRIECKGKHSSGVQVKPHVLIYTTTQCSGVRRGESRWLLTRLARPPCARTRSNQQLEPVRACAACPKGLRLSRSCCCTRSGCRDQHVPPRSCISNGGLPPLSPRSFFCFNDFGHFDDTYTSRCVNVRSNSSVSILVNNT